MNSNDSEAVVLHLPNVVLDQIGSFLPAKDLIRLTMTNSNLKSYFENDRFWQKLASENLYMDRRFLTFRADIMFLLNNAPTKLAKTINFSNRVIRFITYSHDGTMMAIFANGCRLWIFHNDTEIFHVYLSQKRMWDKILTVAFSPDDKHLLVTGTVGPFAMGNNGRETLIYCIADGYVTLQSFVVLDHQMLSTWYDNANIIYMRNEGNRDRMRLYISSIDNQSDIMVYPILAFNFRVTQILVAQHVSPRTRKVVQIGNQASLEGKTLHQKLTEIGLAAGVDVTDMNALKAILDQNEECMPCYRLHAHRDAIPAMKCDCSCHRNTDKLLIFHGNDDKVHAKVITQQTLEDAKEAFRNRGDANNQQPDDNRLFFPLFATTIFDSSDHSFHIQCSLLKNAACFSPDHRYLYITGTRKALLPPLAPFTEIKPICIDLETMVVKRSPDFEAKPWVAYDYDVRISANRDFLAIFTNNEVAIWSTFHQGKSCKVLSGFNCLVSSVAIHPHLNRLLVTNERLVHVYESPQMIKQDLED